MKLYPTIFVSWLKFQKGSPYLEEFNHLLDLKDQMALPYSENGGGISNYIPNSTKCMAWKDVRASHETNATVVITLEDIYGMVILLAICLGGATVAFFLELLSKALRLRIGKTTLNSNQR